MIKYVTIRDLKNIKKNTATKNDLSIELKQKEKKISKTKKELYKIKKKFKSNKKRITKLNKKLVKLEKEISLKKNLWLEVIYINLSIMNL